MMPDRVRQNKARLARSCEIGQILEHIVIKCCLLNLKKAVEAWYRPILGGIFASRL